MKIKKPVWGWNPKRAINKLKTVDRLSRELKAYRQNLKKSMGVLAMLEKKDAYLSTTLEAIAQSTMISPVTLQRLLLRFGKTEVDGAAIDFYTLGKKIGICAAIYYAWHIVDTKNVKRLMLDFAKSALPFLEIHCTKNKKFSSAVTIAENFLNDNATMSELKTALFDEKEDDDFEPHRSPMVSDAVHVVFAAIYAVACEPCGFVPARPGLDIRHYLAEFTCEALMPYFTNFVSSCPAMKDTSGRIFLNFCKGKCASAG